MAAAQGAGGAAAARGRRAGPRHAQRLRLGLLYLLASVCGVSRRAFVCVLLCHNLLVRLSGTCPVRRACFSALCDEASDAPLCCDPSFPDSLRALCHEHSPAMQVQGAVDPAARRRRQHCRRGQPGGGGHRAGLGLLQPFRGARLPLAHLAGRPGAPKLTVVGDRFSPVSGGKGRNTTTPRSLLSPAFLVPVPSSAPCKAPRISARCCGYGVSMPMSCSPSAILRRRRGMAGGQAAARSA